VNKVAYITTIRMVPMADTMYRHSRQFEDSANLLCQILSTQTLNYSAPSAI